MASPARSIAARVSLLIFAASIEYICCSNVAIWAVVWSRVCSCCFLRRSAAFAAIVKSQPQFIYPVYVRAQITSRPTMRLDQEHTILIGADILPGYRVLLIHLIL